MSRRACGLAVLLPGLLAAGLARADFSTAPHLFVPDAAPRAAVVLISDRAGWTAREETVAESLRGQGTAVVGLDLPALLGELAAQDGACAYLTDGFERLSQQLQRRAGGSDYRLPVVAGIGAGGALALAVAAQTPEATVSHTLAVDPEAGIALEKPLCTQAPRRREGDRWAYGLETVLADPMRIVFTAAGDPAARAHAAELQVQHRAIAIVAAPDAAEAAFPRELAALLAPPAPDPLDLPLAILDARPSHDTMAVIYSGDGGWRDIDRQIGATLQAQGIPVVGVDSLRYFWHARTPEETARDLERILDAYRQRWHVGRVLLIGYSFGANILPPTFNRLAAEQRASVAGLSLLAFANRTEFQISVTGWLGIAGAREGADPIDDLRPIPPRLVQCVYGTEEHDSACPRATALGVEVIGIVGGHHFDGDYPALANRIVAGLTRRLAPEGGAAAPQP